MQTIDFGSWIDESGTPHVSDDYANGITVDRFDRIVVAGYTYRDWVTTGWDFAVARLTDSGEFDPTFGSGGLQTVDFGSRVDESGNVVSTDDVATGVIVDGQDRIIVVGSTYGADPTTGGDFAVARLTDSGKLDPDFGSGGLQTIDFGSWVDESGSPYVSDDVASSVALDGAGRIVVGGTANPWWAGTGMDFAAARLTDNGVLDPSFGDTTIPGRVTVDITTWVDESNNTLCSDDSGTGVAIDAQGRIILAGYDNLPWQDYTSDFAVVCLTDSGNLDPGFGSVGKQTVDFGQTYDAALGLSLNPAGMIILAGYSNRPMMSTGNDLALAELDSHGALVNSFGGDGRVITDLGHRIGPTSEIGRDIAVTQGDGKVVVVGSITSQYSPQASIVVARYNPDGSPDVGFGEQGSVILEFGYTIQAGSGVAIDREGRIIVAGTASQDTGGWYPTPVAMVVARLTNSGALDTTFGAGGKQVIDWGGVSVSCAAVAVDGSDRTVLVGTVDQSLAGTASDFAAARLTEAGVLDPDFGTEGRATINLGYYRDIYSQTDFPTSDHGYDVAIDAMGGIVVAGTAMRSMSWQGTGEDFAVARLTDAGSLDLQFGSGGTRFLDFGSWSDNMGQVYVSTDECQGVAIDGAGRIILAGSSERATSYDSDFAAARLSASGNLDTSFGTNGLQTIDFGSPVDHAYDVAIDSSNRIVLAGQTAYWWATPTGTDFAIARLGADGQLDTRFAGTGKQTVDFESTNDTGYGVAVDELKGRILVVGSSLHSDQTTDIAIACLQYNLPPVVGTISGPSHATLAGTRIRVSASFTDPNSTDTHTAAWDWGDGSRSVGIVTESDGSGRVSGSHAYADAGIYMVTLTVTDDSGESARSTFEAVVYDPSAGFVTGEGWIVTPSNSQMAAGSTKPAPAGKAYFTIESRYSKGSAIPTGCTEFRLKQAGLEFHGTSQQWLVVTDSKAQYVGLGRVNGALAPDGKPYQYRIWVTDGDLSKPKAPDQFRIKIWWSRSDGAETVVYDNGADQDLGGGNIAIHGKNKGCPARSALAGGSVQDELAALEALDLMPSQAATSGTGVSHVTRGPGLISNGRRLSQHTVGSRCLEAHQDEPQARSSSQTGRSIACRSTALNSNTTLACSPSRRSCHSRHGVDRSDEPVE